MEFAGQLPGSGYDQLQISGTAALGGTLEIDLLNGFTPSQGESFEIFSGPTTGNFSRISLPPLANGLGWNTSNLDTTGTISVVPEPSALALLATGARRSRAALGGDAGCGGDRGHQPVGPSCREGLLQSAAGNVGPFTASSHISPFRQKGPA